MTKKEKLSELLSSLPCPEVLLCVKSGEVLDVVTVTTMWVSHDPVIAVVYLFPGTTAHFLVNEGRNFTLNVVDETQSREGLLAGALPGNNPKKIEKLGIEFEKSKTVASPTIVGAAASYECRVLKISACGTHDLFLGLVTQSAMNPQGNPVIRFRGESHRIGSPLPGPAITYPH